MAEKLTNRLIELKPGKSIEEIKEGDILRLNESNVSGGGDELVTGICVGVIATLRRAGDLIEKIYRDKRRYSQKTGTFISSGTGVYHAEQDNEYEDLDKQLKSVDL